MYELQKCSDYKASKVNTFARTEPPDTQVTKSVIALLLHYGWNKFTIITESAWSTVARSLEEQATKNNLTVNHYKTVEDRHTCCEERLPCCQVSVWFQLIQETKNMTRSQSKFYFTISIYIAGRVIGTTVTIHPSISRSVYRRSTYSEETAFSIPPVRNKFPPDLFLEHLDLWLGTSCLYFFEIPNNLN